MAVSPFEFQEELVTASFQILACTFYLMNSQWVLAQNHAERLQLCKTHHKPGGASMAKADGPLPTVMQFTENKHNDQQVKAL